ncbi:MULTISPECIES: uroporphyrinogen-III synthase [Psychrobacter]|jgi:uroporphyrinogen-III synthase|uniref:uroporphyrinogen-III synthase n=1 Tax=Psychrobacter TaxID=497 RepID=UPI000C3351C4|nr:MULTISPECIES: uroporphyrinogen-III synthase [Psychrobacter]PKG36048.1 uroporphyrinogen-III synthase [Psychrobacter sp. Sarcosine-3u-12]
MSYSTSQSTDSNRSTENLSAPQQVVINTRPIERAAPLTQCLQAAGLSVIEMPMLTLQARATTDKDRQMMRQWLAGDYQALVIVSPTAAASGLAMWQALEVERQKPNKTTELVESALMALETPSHLIAVGDATAAVLNNAQLPVASYQVRQPSIANNEGMLAMPEIESLQAGDKLLIWRGLGGRRLLVDTLQARGVHIDSIAWYERIMPEDAQSQYEQWLQDFYAQNALQANATVDRVKPIVVISSGTAFEHWASIVEAAVVKVLDEKNLEAIANQSKTDNAALKLSDFAYVVLGERLANMVAQQQLSYWRVEDLAPETILAAINSKTL